MLDKVQKQRKIRSITNLSRYQGGEGNRNYNKSLHKTYKTISSMKTITNLNTQKQGLIKQKRLLSSSIPSSRAFLKAPYQSLLSQLKISLPSPKQKFYQFLLIPPFNRTPHHFELIQYFLKGYKFFKQHPNDILKELAKKVRLCHKDGLDTRVIVVVEKGQATYDRDVFRVGDLLSRKEVYKQDVIANQQANFLVFNRHQYLYLVNQYFIQNKAQFKTFLTNVQIFKMFNSNTLNKFVDSLTVNYLSEGQYLYKFGNDVHQLYIVLEGKAIRRVIVQIDKTNKIPLLKYSKIVKTLSKSYEHKIQFVHQDLIGIAQVIDHIQTRKQNIKIAQNSIILGLDKHVFQQNLDQYIIDRLRKYNLKKYPVTYDKLCEKYQKQKTLRKQQQLRKIQALKSTINNSISQKKSEKINLIIKKYHQNIKQSQIQNLLGCKIQQRTVQRQ